MKHYFIHENSLVAVVLLLLMHLPPFVICIECSKNISENCICLRLFAEQRKDFNESRKCLWFGWIRIHLCKCFGWTTIWFVEFRSEQFNCGEYSTKNRFVSRSSCCINWQCSFKIHRSKSYLAIITNGLTTLSGSIGSLVNSQVNLESLELNRKNWTTLPAKVSDNLVNLKTLHLDWNELRALPKNIFKKLAKREELSLNGNNLTKLPANIFMGLIQ